VIRSNIDGYGLYSSRQTSCIRSYPNERRAQNAADLSNEYIALIIMTRDVQVLCKCAKQMGVAAHSCPFKREIHDDVTTLCNCCEVCEQECREDI
jgi:hypothetical protein